MTFFLVSNVLNSSRLRRQLQLVPSEKIFDDRPKPDPDIPSVALLYEGFGHFLDIMDGRDDVPGLADINVKKLYSEVDTFASKMNEYYRDENDQRDAVLPCLTHIFSARRGIQIPSFTQIPLVPSEPMAIILQLMEREPLL